MATEVEKISVSDKKEKKSKKEKKEEKEEEETQGEVSLFASQLNQMVAKNGDISTVIKKQKGDLTNLLGDEEARGQFLQWLVEHMTQLKTIPKIAVVVKQLYDEDLLEEEEIIAWYNGLKNQTVKTSVTPLIKWFE